MISGQGLTSGAPSSNINSTPNKPPRATASRKKAGRHPASLPLRSLSLSSLSNSWLASLFSLVAKSTLFISVPSLNPVSAQDRGDYMGFRKFIPEIFSHSFWAAAPCCPGSSSSVEEPLPSAWNPKPLPTSECQRAVQVKLWGGVADGHTGASPTPAERTGRVKRFRFCGRSSCRAHCSPTAVPPLPPLPSRCGPRQLQFKERVIPQFICSQRRKVQL